MQRGERQCLRQREGVERKEARGERGGTPRERQPKRRGKDRSGIYIYWGRYPQSKTAYVAGAAAGCWAVDTKPENNKGESREHRSQHPTGGGGSPNGEI
jgi:hypothetical protein